MRSEPTDKDDETRADPKGAGELRVIWEYRPSADAEARVAKAFEILLGREFEDSEFEDLPESAEQSYPKDR